MKLENKEIKAFIQAKCEELLAPLYAELEALQVQPKEEEIPDFSEDVAILKSEGLLK
jgi:hypothetical protein